MTGKNNASSIKDCFKRIDVFMLAIYLYMFLPLIIFVGLWLKPIYALIGLCLIISGIYLSLINEKPLWKPKKTKHTFVVFAFIIFIIALVVVTSGIGGSVIQYPDHLYRNALFRLLVDYDWPVKLTKYRTKGLTYYIGFWLPAALVSKFTSYQFGMLFLQIWSVIGLFIVFYLICERKKQIKLWYFIVFLLFGGADYVGYSLIGKTFTQVGNRIEWWAVVYNYPGFLTGLFWVYNQIIYAFIIHAMIMRQENNKNILFIWSASLINCTFPAIGMIPFAVFRAIQNSNNKRIIERIKDGVLSTFSIQFVLGFILSLVSTLYLANNIAVVNNIEGSSLSLGAVSSSINAPFTTNAQTTTVSPYPWTTKLYIYLWFILLEFGLYYVTIYKSQNNKSIFWVTLLMLILCPLIQIGGWIDFCMRGSIPALYCLYEMVIDALEDYIEKKEFIYVSAIVLLISISAMNCKDTLLGIMQPMADVLWNHEEVNAESFSDNFVFYADNFFSLTSDSFFFKYLAK